MAFDHEGHLYVTDGWFHTLQIFGHDPRVKDPKALTVLMFLGGGGRGPGQFLDPGEIYINQEDQLFVADQLNRRIQVIQYLGSHKTGSTDAKHSGNAEATKH
jgi:hypothetical protein